MSNITPNHQGSEPEAVNDRSITSRPRRHSDRRNRAITRLAGVALAALCAPDVLAALIRLLVAAINAAARQIP